MQATRQTYPSQTAKQDGNVGVRQINPMVMTADLGNEEFATFAELTELVREKHQEAPCPLVAVYITPFQQKLLRLEAFERRRLTNEQAARLQFRAVAGTRYHLGWGRYAAVSEFGSQHD